MIRVVEAGLKYLDNHILICTDASSCGLFGAAGIKDALKDELKIRGLRLRNRDGACSCMGLCLKGANAVIWPEGKWLAGLELSDVPRLADYLQGKQADLSDLEAAADDKIRVKLQNP